VEEHDAAERSKSGLPMKLIGKLIVTTAAIGLTTSFITSRIPGAIINEGVFYTALIIWGTLSIVAMIVIAVCEPQQSSSGSRLY